MGNPSILKEEIMKNSQNTLGQVYHRGAVLIIIRNVIKFLFPIERFFSLYLRQLVKLNGHFMTKIQASIKQGEIDEAIVSCDNNKVLLQMQLNLH
jgi:biopolymer transport protein ExbB